MKFDTQYCWSKCLHELSWYVHDHDYMNMTWYELSLSDSMMLSENNKQSENHKKNESENDIFRQFFEICQIWVELFYMLTWKQDHEIFTVTMKDIKKILESKSYADSCFFVFKKYYNLIDVFERQKADELTSHQKEYDIEIDLKLEKISSFEFLYNMLWDELQMLQQYLNEHLIKDFIQSNHSSFVFSVLFAKKSSKEL